MIMKMNKLVTTSLLGVSLLTTAYAGVVPNMESYKAEITKIRRTETPGKVLSLVQSVDQEIRLDLSVALLKVVADRSHSLLPSTVSSLSSKFPAFAAELAAEASKLAPEYATSIAQAASVSAPAQSHLIAAAVAKQNPSKAVRIARTVSEVLPSHELQISYFVSQVEPQVARGLSTELQTGLSYLGQDIALGFDYSAGAQAFTASIATGGFQGQSTVAQAEAAELVFQVLSKTPPAEQAAVKAQLDVLLNPANKLKLSDIRALSTGGSVSVGGVSTTLGTVFTAAGATTDPTTVQLDATEVSTAGTTAVTKVQEAVVTYVKTIASNPALSDADKSAAIKKLAPTAGNAAIQAIITAAPEDLDAAIADNAKAAVDSNVATTGGSATIADTTVEVRVVTDAYGAL
jgi:hypothetical protein